VVGLTYALAHPDAEHVHLQETLVEALAAMLAVHEEVVEEGADPGRDAAH